MEGGGGVLVGANKYICRGATEELAAREGGSRTRAEERQRLGEDGIDSRLLPAAGGGRMWAAFSGPQSNPHKQSDHSPGLNSAALPTRTWVRARTHV